MTLSQFMSKSTKRCLSFHKILKKDKSFEWNKECEKAFAHVKEYLSYPLILTRLEAKETLFLYIVTFDEAVGTVFIIERDVE